MKTQQVSTGALIVRPDGKFLLTKRSLTDDFMPGLWEIPGGGSEYGETPEQTTIREIQEECGINVKVLAPLTTHSYYMGETQRVEIIFLCAMEGDQKVTLSEEHIEYAWTSKDELVKYELDEFMRKLLSKITEDLDYFKQKYCK